MLDLILKVRGEVLGGGTLSYEDALSLTGLPSLQVPYLAAAANEVREKFVGNKIESCALSNIKSGQCSEDCRFCAQSAHYETDSPVYPQIPVEAMVQQAKEAEKAGATEFCLVSSGWGAVNEKDFQAILEAVRRIAKETRLCVDCSLGFLSDDQMKRLKEAGLYRNNHNLETSRRYFEKVCTTHTFDERFRHLKRAQLNGIHPCSGGILGMGETVQDRLDLAFSLKEAGAECVPINILNPRQGTPLEEAQTPPPMEIIKMIAIYRLILPKSTIKIAGGREVNLRDLQAMAMLAGANGLIIGNYLTTMGRNPAKDVQMLKDLGFHVESNGTQKSEGTKQVPA